VKKGLVLLPLFGAALEVQPWFGDVYEFHLLAGFSYSYFDRVSHGTPELQDTFYSRVTYAGLEFSPGPAWDIDIDTQVADTTKERFGWRESGIQIRYLWSDDIVGDPITFVTGASARFISTSALHDVSSAYHGNVDFELSGAFGKEWDPSDLVRFRFWGYGALGHANRGSPWVKGIVSAEANVDERHKLSLWFDGICGYGAHRTVFIDDFDGYAKIRNRSIDVGVRYGYKLGVFGTIRFDYLRRLLAKSCPSQVNAFGVSYLLPFSF
jgi:hypothetical protein